MVRFEPGEMPDIGHDFIKVTFMTFNDLVSNFHATPACTDAFDSLHKGCLDLTRNEPHNAIAYYLIAGFARTYVILFDEEATDPQTAKKAKEQIEDYLRRIQSALANQSPEMLTSSLNSIVLDYLQSDRIF